MWTLFALAVLIGLVEAVLGIGPYVLPSLLGELSTDRLVRPITGLLLVLCAVVIPAKLNVGRIVAVVVCALAVVDDAAGAVTSGELSVPGIVAVALWLVVPAVAFLPPVNRAARVR